MPQDRPVSTLQSISPLLAGLGAYRRDVLTGDLVAAMVVAAMLVPQAMAYAMLAGLPPQVGLYASIVPLVLYGLFGTSNSLAVGPVALISLLVLSGVGQLAEPGSAEFIALCLTLAAMVGAIKIAMAILRMGFLVNFISHPVLIGFTSAGALVIGFSQLKHLLGIQVPQSEYPIEWMIRSVTGAVDANAVTVLMGLLAIALLLAFAKAVAPILQRFGVARTPAALLAKLGPLLVVMLAVAVVGLGNLDETARVSIVGTIPSGLPSLTWPELTLSSVGALFPLALVIALVGYMESISVAKALASRKRQKVDPNRELFALGMADVGAAFTGGYPVAGGFSRSIVNDAAGARTPMASVLTAAMVAIAAAFLAPLFYYIPQTVLAAIVVVAVLSLIDLKAPVELWRYSRHDAIAYVITFLSVIVLGIETGIMIGIGTTIALWMWQTSRPHIAEVGRIPGSEHFRNVLRHKVETIEGVLAVRIDESLNFTNTRYLHEFLTARLAERREIHSVLLIASGINHIDATGMEMLKELIEQMHEAGVHLVLSDVKGPVMDCMHAAAVDPAFLESNVYLSADLAARALGQRSHPDNRAAREKDNLEPNPTGDRHAT